MLTLSLTLTPPATIAVQVDGVPSHSFPLQALALSEQEVKAFFADPAPLGQRLYHLLFPADSPAARALQALPLTPDEAGRLALHLTDAALHALPWEYLHDGHAYLATERPFLRLIKKRSACAPSERLSLLFIPSDPLMYGDTVSPYPLGLTGEWNALKAALSDLDPPLDLEEVRPPTFGELQKRLAGRRGLILHFTGHGDLEDGRGWLVFEQPSGRADRVPAEEVSAAWRGRAALVVLSACLSAAPGEGQAAKPGPPALRAGHALCPGDADERPRFQGATVHHPLLPLSAGR